MTEATIKIVNLVPNPKFKVENEIAFFNNVAPYIGANGNWYIYDKITEDFIDSGMESEGTDGTTPVKGVDYFTQADKTELISQLMTGAAIVTAINEAAGSLIDNDNLSAGVNTAITNAHTHSNKTVLDNTTASFLTTQETKLGNITVTQAVNLDTIESDTATNNAKVTNATHTGDVTGATALTIGDGKVTLAKMANLSTQTIVGRNTAADGVPEQLSMATVKTMLGLGTAAYVATTTLATSAQGTLADNAVPKGSYTAINDILVGTGAGTFIKKTPGEVRTILNVADGATNNLGTVTAVTGTAPVVSSGGSAPAISMAAATNAVPGYATAAHIAAIEANTAKVTNATHTGDVTGATALTIGANKVTLAHMAQVATASILGRTTAATGNVEVLTAANVRTIITDSSNRFITDSERTAWAAAATASHAQNTDTGTSSDFFNIGTGGVRLVKNGATELQVKNTDGSAFADIRVNNLTVDGTTTTINSNDVNIGDNEIILNSDITTSATNSDGGIAIKRLMADNSTRKDAKLTFNNTLGKFQTTHGAVAGTLVTAQLTNKVVAAIGDGALTTYVITHNLNTQDAVVSIRETASTYAQVFTDVEMTSVNTITVKFAVAPTASQYTVTIVG